MKTTIYELLGMIKDGKAPKRIIYKNNCYEWFDDEKDYITETHWLFDEYVITDILNDEVEILDEPKDNFTGWKMYQDGEVVCSMDCSPEEDKKIEKLNISDIDYFTMNKKINEIIDKLNKEE